MAGTLAERCQMAAYLCYSVALAGFVYPVVRNIHEWSIVDYIIFHANKVSHIIEHLVVFLSVRLRTPFGRTTDF